MADPVLSRLIANANASLEALTAYVAGETVSPKDDLVSLKDAEVEFRRSNDTCRRWAREEDLGVEINGRWFLSRSLVRRHKAV